MKKVVFRHQTDPDPEIFIDELSEVDTTYCYYVTQGMMVSILTSCKGSDGRTVFGFAYTANHLSSEPLTQKDLYFTAHTRCKCIELAIDSGRTVRTTQQIADFTTRLFELTNAVSYSSNKKE